MLFLKCLCMLKSGGKVMGMSYKSLNFTTKKETLLIEFELNPTWLRA